MTGQRPEADADAQPTTGLEDLESTAKLPVLDAATIESLEDEAELAHQRTTVLNPDTFHDAGTQPAIPILDVSPELLAGFEGRVVVRGESGAGAAAGRGDEAAHDVDASRVALEQELAGFQSQVESLERQVGELNSELTRLGRMLVERDAQIGELRQAQRGLQRELERDRSQAAVREERLEADLDAARRLGEDLDAMRREAIARSEAAEQREAALEAEFAAARARLEADTEALRARLGEEQAAALAQLEARATQARLEAVGATAAEREALEKRLKEAEQRLEAQAAAARAEREREFDALREAHAAELAAQRLHDAGQMEAERRRLGDELTAALTAAGERSAAQEVGLQAARGEAASLQRQLEELRTRKAADEAALAQGRERIATLERELDAARAELAAATARAQSSATEQSRELETTRRELAELRALAAAQVEALQAAESRRGIWASLLGDAESRHESALGEARTAAASERARAAAAEAALEAQRRSQAEAEAALRSDAETAAARARETEAALRAELDAAASRAREVESQRASLQATLADAEASLQALRGESGDAGRRLAEAEAELGRLRERERELAAAGEAAAARIAAADRDLDGLRASASASEGMLRGELATLREEREALATKNQSLTEALDRASKLAAEAADAAPAEQLRDLQAELRRSAERVAELESDLRAAEDQINRLEGDLRLKNTRLDELSRSGASGDERGMARRRDEAPPRGRPELVAAGEGLASADSAFSGAAASADGVTRYFVMMEGDTEIVHVLGRRTTIGRGLDNDVRIDTKFVSRHHAVVLAGPQQTVVEDLRSTNGVTVNGRRVTRAVLRDGDVVHVGKTQFRFVQRTRER